MNIASTTKPVAPLPIEALDYELPSHLIATRPSEPRDSARLLVMSRSHDRIEHRQVRDLPGYIAPTDLLAFNNTAVLPARLIGHRAKTGGKVEGLYLHDVSDQNRTNCCRMMIKSGGKLEPGERLQLTSSASGDSSIAVQLIQKDEADWIVQIEGGVTAMKMLADTGRTPLPPYILQARQSQQSSDHPVSDELDQRWYQTVYADRQRRQSVAAPTAGLHFTPQLLAAIDAKGIQRINVTLHVGVGTFKPITAATLAEHRMHSESFEVADEVIAALRQFRSSQPTGRIVAVGTTTVRTLESLPNPLPENCGRIAGMTDLMIAPPYDFRLVDGLLTNFHLPRSTLLALVAAMVDRGDGTGLQRLKAVYGEAVKRAYRFYSYGDAMLVLP